LRIQIIGAGTVGFATGEGFNRLGHDVTFYDIDKSLLSKLEKRGFQTSTSLISSEFNFICVPEWEVENVIKNLERVPGLVVIRSTVNPGITEKLGKKYNRHILHNPEFLREATADWDFMNPDRIVIGECCKKHGKILEKLYEPLRVPIIRVDPKTSEMVKLASNAYLSTLISYWNEIHKICTKLNINSHKVGLISSMDKRISRYGASMHGKPFAGLCLPKDLDHLIVLFDKNKITPKLLEIVKEINEGMK
jgi:UDPglucose 6-dehydrogenase